MKLDIAPDASGTFKLDDSVVFFSVNSEAKMEGVEFGHGVDVAYVKQNSAKDGHEKASLTLLGHHTGQVACKGYDLSDSAT